MGGDQCKWSCRKDISKGQYWDFLIFLVQEERRKERIYKYGFAFDGKKVQIGWEQEDKNGGKKQG